MKVVIVFNHPFEGSYCNAFLNSIQNGIQKAGHDQSNLNIYIFP